MGDEQPELEALRRRAYGPDADIHDDADALARLVELEELVRLERAPREAPSPDEESTLAEAEASELSAPPAAVLVGGDSSGPRSPRWHTGLVTATAVVAVLLGGAAWTAAQVPSADARPAGHAKTAAVATERRAAGYEAGYDLYLDGLREEVLTLAGTQDIADLMIRDQLRPYGILYGRTVGVGPTTDNRFCMIIEDLPASAVTCISIENAYANPVSVTLPSWYTDADSDVFTGLGELISYTLMPGVVVVAVPADSAGG